MISVKSPFAQYFELNGEPLDSGYIYFGVENQNPETSPVTVYWDEGATVPAAQPIRTISGYVSRNGTPALLFVPGNCSITARDKNGALVYSLPSSSSPDVLGELADSTTGTNGAGMVGYRYSTTYPTNTVGSALTSIINGNEFVVNSITELRTVSKTVYTHTFVTGYYTNGDGGGGSYRLDPADTTSADNGGTVIVAADGGRWKLLADGVVHARQFGAIGDGSLHPLSAFFGTLAAAQAIYPHAVALTDQIDWVAIQAGINWLAAVGGGTLEHDRGAYRINRTVTVGASDIKLHGAGHGDFHYAGTSPSAACRYVWNGSAVGFMVLFNPGGVQWMTDNGFDGIYLDGGSGIERAIGIYSCFGGRFIAHSTGVTICVMLTGCSTTLTDTADCMNNHLAVRGTSLTAGLLQMTGTPAANTCFNRIEYLDGNYKDAVAVQLYNCDNNVIERIRLFREVGGTAAGVAFNGGAFNEEARSNVIIDCSPGAGGVRAAGTETGAASASKDNYIEFYDTPNGAPLPTYGTGASLWYGTNDSKFPAVIAYLNTGTFGAGPTDVVWNSELVDLQNNLTSGVFTAPKPGFYRIKWTLSHTSGVTVGDKWNINVVSSTEEAGFIYTVPTAVDRSVSNEVVIPIGIGGTAKVQITRAGGTGNFPLIADSRYNRFEVTHVARSF